MIELDNVTRRYGRRRGIEEVSLRIAPGTLYGFLGPNGAGKTTTIRVMLGLLRAQAGSARIFDRDCWHDSAAIKRDVGYLPGDLRLYRWMTCRSSLQHVERIRGRAMMDEGLSLARNWDLDPDVRVSRMSRGMRQKLGLVLTLAHRPRLLVMDEPTAALDPLMQEALYVVLRERVADGATVFFSSHTLAEVERLCDRVAIVRRGRIVADEALSALRLRARRVVTIHWGPQANSATIEPPPGLDVYQRESQRWSAAPTLPVADVVRWAAGQPIEDLTISPPDLATVFQSYYQSDGEESS